MKNARAKRAKPEFFIVKFSNLWSSCRRRGRACLTALSALHLQGNPPVKFWHLVFCLEPLDNQSVGPLLYKMLLLYTKIMACVWTAGGCTSLFISLNQSLLSSSAVFCQLRQANDGQRRLFRLLCSLIHANFQPSLLLVLLFFFSVSTDRPITFLFNTLNYYENCLRDKPSLKKKLVGAIIGEFTRLYLVSFGCSRFPPLGWFLKGKLYNPQ